MKWLLLFLPVSLPAQVVSWNLPMLNELGAIADTATVEHFRCLLGAWQGDTLFIVAAHEPEVRFANAFGVGTGPCPPLITWGEYHNHLPLNLTINGEIRPALPPEAMCDLSPLDRRSEIPFQVIYVNKDVSCAWVLINGKYKPLIHWPPRESP